MVPGWMVGWLSVSVSMAPATTLMAKTMFQPVVIPFPDIMNPMMN